MLSRIDHRPSKSCARCIKIVQSFIATLLAQDFVRLVLGAVLIASPIAWYAMHQWLQDFTYHIPLSGWIFLVAALSATFMAVLTVSTQAIRAARANPAKNLWTE